MPQHSALLIHLHQLQEHSRTTKRYFAMLMAVLLTSTWVPSPSPSTQPPRPSTSPSSQTASPSPSPSTWLSNPSTTFLCLSTVQVQVRVQALTSLADGLSVAYSVCSIGYHKVYYKNVWLHETKSTVARTTVNSALLSTVKHSTVWWHWSCDWHGLQPNLSKLLTPATASWNLYVTFIQILTAKNDVKKSESYDLIKPAQCVINILCQCISRLWHKLL